MKQWKFLKIKDGQIVSRYDSSPWTIGVWRTVPPPTEECKGLNASRFIQDTLRYVHGTVLALVECRGKCVKGTDKTTWEEMRIIRAWPWTKEASVRLAVAAARDVLGIWEARYPKDLRPRKALEAAEAWLQNPSAAYAAADAYAADAAYAAAAAADAAYAADAADAAAAAADAASAAAAYAAAADARQKQRRRIHAAAIEIVKTLEETKP